MPVNSSISFIAYKSLISAFRYFPAHKHTNIINGNFRVIDAGIHISNLGIY